LAQNSHFQESFTGILGDNILLKMSVYEITQDTGLQLVERLKKMKLLLDLRTFSTYVKESTKMGNEIGSSGIMILTNILQTRYSRITHTHTHI